MDVRVIKLVNGEELIGEYSEAFEGSAIIKDPFAIVYANKGIHLLKYMPYTVESERLVIKPEHIVFTRNAIQGLADDYVQARSGIRMGA